MTEVERNMDLNGSAPAQQRRIARYRIQYLVLKPEFFIEAKGSSFHTFRQNALAEPSVQLPHFRSV